MAGVVRARQKDEADFSGRQKPINMLFFTQSPHSEAASASWFLCDSGFPIDKVICNDFSSCCAVHVTICFYAPQKKRRKTKTEKKLSNNNKIFSIQQPATKKRCFPRTLTATSFLISCRFHVSDGLQLRWVTQWGSEARRMAWGTFKRLIKAIIPFNSR